MNKLSSTLLPPRKNPKSGRFSIRFLTPEQFARTYVGNPRSNRYGAAQQHDIVQYVIYGRFLVGYIIEDDRVNEVPRATSFAFEPALKSFNYHISRRHPVNDRFTNTATGWVNGSLRGNYRLIQQRARTHINNVFAVANLLVDLERLQ